MVKKKDPAFQTQEQLASTVSAEVNSTTTSDNSDATANPNGEVHSLKGTMFSVGVVGAVILGMWLLLYVLYMARY